MAAFTEERKREVLQKTEQLLLTRDYAKLTMLRVAKELKISKETLYRYFGNKTGLFREVILYRSAKIREGIDKALQYDDKPAQEVLVQVIYLYLKTVISSGGAVLNRIAVSEVNQSPELAATLVENGRGNVLPVMVEFFDRLKEKGILQQQTATENMVELLIGMAAADMQIRLILNDLKEIPDDAALLERAERAVDYLFRLFGGEGRKEE